LVFVLSLVLVVVLVSVGSGSGSGPRFGPRSGPGSLPFWSWVLGPGSCCGVLSGNVSVLFCCACCFLDAVKTWVHFWSPLLGPRAPCWDLLLFEKGKRDPETVPCGVQKRGPKMDPHFLIFNKKTCARLDVYRPGSQVLGGQLRGPLGWSRGGPGPWVFGASSEVPVTSSEVRRARFRILRRL